MLDWTLRYAFAALLALGAQDGPQTIEGGALTDHDYRFEIRAPNEDWRLLDQDTVQAILPDHLAGLRGYGRTRGFNMVVFAEALSSLDIDEYADILVGNMMFETSRVLARETVELAGREALRVDVEGDAGMPVRIALFLLPRDDYYYQVHVSGPAAAADFDGMVDEAISSFSLLEGTVRSRAVVIETADTYGIGQLVENGRFSSLAYDFTVEPPVGYRLSVGDDLRQMSSDAEIGLIGSVPDVYVTVTVEAARGEAAAIIHGMNVVESEESARHFTYGAERSFSVWADEYAGLPLEFRHTTFLHDGKSFQIMTWYQAGDRERALQSLPAALAAIRPLESGTRSELVGRLARRPDPDSTIADGQALRGGTFVDFDRGVSWKKPADGGFWRATAGSGLVAKEELGCELFVEQPVTGFWGRLYFDEETEIESSEEYHELAVLYFTEGMEPLERGETRELGDRETEILATEIDVTHDGLPFRYVIATTRRDGLGVDLVLQGTRSNLESGAASVDACLKGLRMHEGPVEMTSIADDHFRDLRLGFELTAPPEWILVEDTPEPLRPIGRTIEAKENGDTRMLVVAVQPPADNMRVEALVEQFGSFLPDRVGVLGVKRERKWIDGRLGSIETRVTKLGTLFRTTGEIHTFASGACLYGVWVFGDRAQREAAAERFSLLSVPLGDD